MKLFVYGTLRSGYGNYRLLRGCRCLGTLRTVPGYRLYHYGIPYVVPSPRSSASVEGEVYEVNEAALARIDDLEGHPIFYERKPVKLSDGSMAEGYFMSFARLPLEARYVPSGKFTDVRTRAD